MNHHRTPDEGLSYVVSEGQKFTLKEAVESEGPRMVGNAIWETYQRWPVYSKFFDNSGPIMHHLHQSDEQAKLVGREGKPEGYYFPPQLNASLGNFPHTYFGLEPGTSREEIPPMSRPFVGTRATTEFSIYRRPIVSRQERAGSCLHEFFMLLVLS